jgi:branched-subunit amino acid aminotransferase/4-amino-4-deoxychorismate lyase
MTSWLWIGDRFEPCDSVPLTDRGFRYGMSVFESLRVNRGEPEFFEPHLARLLSACADRSFSVPEAALRVAAEVLQNHAASGFARLYVTGWRRRTRTPAGRSHASSSFSRSALHPIRMIRGRSLFTMTPIACLSVD